MGGSAKGTKTSVTKTNLRLQSASSINLSTKNLSEKEKTLDEAIVQDVGSRCCRPQCQRTPRNRRLAVGLRVTRGEEGLSHAITRELARAETENLVRPRSKVGDRLPLGPPSMRESYRILPLAGNELLNRRQPAISIFVFPGLAQESVGEPSGA